MSTNSNLLQIGTLEVLLIRKPIKNLHLSVLPPDGKIRVSSPMRMKDDAIRTLIATRIPWIRKQRAKFAEQPRQTPREFVSGEDHYFLGQRYRLEVVVKDEPSRVFLKGKNRIVLQVRSNATLERRREVMMDWYRKELRIVAGELLEKWQNKISAQVKSWGIKKMRTRWGTCNQKTGSVWLNLELMKKPSACIEYVVVHELLHLIEKKHNERFASLMMQYLPKWLHSKQELNRFILSHEKWSYRT